ncbi:MAG: hypothetical protein HVN35_00750 [Methanobacteriaceae archaeon]|nr:hypothetical protein [Methanobacteriaceae archaeon]
MNNLKKGILICALVMMVSMVPAFALNDTSNNTTGDQISAQTTSQNQHHYGQKNAASGNCGTCDGSGNGSCDGTCDGDQHKYQYGQKNSAKGTGNCDQPHKYQYGQKNSNSGNGNCDGQNCKNTTT